MVAVMDVAAAAALLEGVANGWQPDDLGPLSERPTLVIDLDSPGPADSLAGLTPLPCVIVGISQRAAPPAAPPQCDVLLSGAPDPPRPWVALPGGLAAGLSGLVERISAAPTAACTLSQLLRAGETLSVQGALIAESLAYSTLQSGPEFARWLMARPPRPPASAARMPGAPREEPVLVALQDDVLRITLNRPHQRNAFDTAMRDGLIAALELALVDDTIASVHLAGAGAGFCSGGDLNEFGSRPDPATAHLVRTTRSAGARLARCAERTTVYLHGACVGAGIELPAFAGWVSAAPGTRIMLPEVAMGLVPGAGGTASISRRIGRQRCAWLALSGEWIDAELAWRWGLVDEVLPA